MLLAIALVMPASAQSRTEREKLAAQSELTAAEAALASAQAASAPTLATELFNEAADRLRQARTGWNNDNRQERERAGRRAVEARYAAEAAKAQALLLGTNAEVRTLRTEIASGGGNALTIDLYEPPTTMNRGVTSLDRVIVAENALRMARAAGGERFAANELENIEGRLKTARLLSKNAKQNESADHLAYVAEMEARRIEMTARLNAINGVVPDLRAERARLQQRVADTRAQEANLRAQQEEQRRLQAEREVARLREQMSTTEAQFRERLEMDRRARVEAEQELDDLMRAYEAALAQGSTSNDEVDRMRREIETQSLALRSMQERERASETSMSNQIASLEQALARERSEGALNADAAARRETELRHQREELDRLRAEREESDRRRVEAENARATAIAEAEQRRAAAEQARAIAEQGRSTAEAEAARLRENVAQTSAALDEARTELARRDAANRARIETMRTELAKLADTRSSERGFIVTLPGLFFDSGKSVLKPGARNTLSRIADQLRTVEAAEIAIEGHTDSVGSDAMNQGLSEKRAAAVQSYLVSRGVPASRIKTTGLGESAPVASNDTPAGRQQNRRVELVIATPQQ